MRVVFAGTPPFAVAALEALLAAGHDVPLVLTQPDRPAGRGLRLTASAVSDCAAGHGLTLYKPPSLKLPDSQDPIREARPDVMVVAAYGLILPAAVLAIPGKGCINIHASLLPRWRGAAPIQRAILAGDPETGVCIMQMETGLDTGPVLLERSIPIAPRDTAAGLTRSLAALGAEALVEALGRLESLAPKAQDATRATYAAKIDKAEARIDWSRSARDVDRQIRAFNPVPGAETSWKGQSLKVWEALPAAGSGPPGTLLGSGPDGLVIACGEGALAALEIQRQGSKRMRAGEFLRGYPLESGGLFGT